MKVLAVRSGFMMGLYQSPELQVVALDDPHADPRAIIREHRDAAFIYWMNQLEAMGPFDTYARAVAAEYGIPTVWQTIEDPNHYQRTRDQAEGFDLICTTDEVLIPEYRKTYPHALVAWVPLAANPLLHAPTTQPPPEGPDEPVDFVLVANWYSIEERLEGVANVVEPIVAGAAAGRWTFALYSYPDADWPAHIRCYRRGACGYLDAARCYAQGRVVLAVNNQARNTAMTSMRTFEVLACAKPMLAAWSDAYTRLGFIHGEHFVWSRFPDETLRLASTLLTYPANAQHTAELGRAFVLKHHTYRHRLRTIMDTLYPNAAGRGPERGDR